METGLTISNMDKELKRGQMGPSLRGPTTWALKMGSAHTHGPTPASFKETGSIIR